MLLVITLKNFCNSIDLPLGHWITDVSSSTPKTFSVEVPDNNTALRFRLIGSYSSTTQVRLILTRVQQYEPLFTLTSYGEESPSTGMTCPEIIPAGNYTITISSQQRSNFTMFSDYFHTMLTANSFAVSSWTSYCIDTITNKNKAGVIFKLQLLENISQIRLFVYLTSGNNTDRFQPLSSDQDLVLYGTRSLCPDPDRDVYSISTVISETGTIWTITQNSSLGISAGNIYILVTQRHADSTCNKQRHFFIGYCTEIDCVVSGPNESSSTTGIASTTIQNPTSEQSTTLFVSTSTNSDQISLANSLSFIGLELSVALLILWFQT